MSEKIKGKYYHVYNSDYVYMAKEVEVEGQELVELKSVKYKNGAVNVTKEDFLKFYKPVKTDEPETDEPETDNPKPTNPMNSPKTPKTPK